MEDTNEFLSILNKMTEKGDFIIVLSQKSYDKLFDYSDISDNYHISKMEAIKNKYKFNIVNESYLDIFSDNIFIVPVIPEKYLFEDNNKELNTDIVKNTEDIIQKAKDAGGF